MPKKTENQYTPEEAQHRFEAALRGARITGHKPMSEVSPKRKPKSASSDPKKGRARKKFSPSKKV